MVPLLKPLRLKAGEHLWRESEPPSEVYFIKKGKINYIMQGIQFQSMVIGSYFGELDVIFNAPRSYDAIASPDIKETELLSLERTKFLDILDQY